MFEVCLDPFSRTQFRTVIEILESNEEFQGIFKCLQREYSQGTGEKMETIIQWYIELFKSFPELIGLQKEVFESLIKDLPFDNPRLVKGIIYLACMNSVKNKEYSMRVMSQLIDRFYAIRAQAKFDDKI